MTLAMMVVIDVKIKNSTEGQIISIEKEKTQFKKRLSQATIGSSGAESNISWISAYRFQFLHFYLCTQSDMPIILPKHSSSLLLVIFQIKIHHNPPIFSYKGVFPAVNGFLFYRVA